MRLINIKVAMKKKKTKFVFIAGDIFNQNNEFHPSLKFTTTVLKICALKLTF